MIKKRINNRKGYVTASTIIATLMIIIMGFLGIRFIQYSYIICNYEVLKLFEYKLSKDAYPVKDDNGDIIKYVDKN
ncbi:hypothetical protein BFS06_13750 [Clostridium perfringens]|uniref:Uncharacterized protein n=1 Tax=Clostridium perfringens TaxID=1502 RepID=A0A140GRS2_CLOPF|nr:hypothetical protein [Clostridium perfringens]AMN31231.1 hypothetical protein JFP838_pA0315 [Clostridium perfringens]TBX14269.1 hypothetical protein BFS06_13750 [Clostridium perfringens]